MGEGREKGFEVSGGVAVERVVEGVGGDLRTRLGHFRGGLLGSYVPLEGMGRDER